MSRQRKPSLPASLEQGDTAPASVSEFLLYTAEDGRSVIQVRLEGGTLWLSQKQIAELFQIRVPTVNAHLKGIFAEGELPEASVVRKHLITATDGKNYKTKFYSLDVVLAVGYRVRTQRGTQFRQWATEHLREFLAKGFVMDDARLKEGTPRGIDYFDELLERIRDIRSSEKVFYRKVRDIFALSADYGDHAQEALTHFFQKVQNKMHWAATGQTAAELIRSRSRAEKPNMGLTAFAGDKVQRKDVTTAKNYLGAEELDTLNRIVFMFLEYAEMQAKRRQVIYMAEWEERLDGFLTFNELPVLTHAGRMRMDVAQAHALEQYETFHSARLERIRQVEIEEDARQDAALDQAAKAAQAIAPKDQGGKTPTGGKGGAA